MPLMEFDCLIIELTTLRKANPSTIPQSCTTVTLIVDIGTQLILVPCLLLPLSFVI